MKAGTNPLYGHFLFNHHFTFVMTTFRTYPVVLNGGAAILAGAKGRYHGFIMGPSLVPSLLGNFVFWIWHDKYELII